MPVMKLKVTVNGDEFSFDGDATFTEIGPLLDQWFKAQEAASDTAKQIAAFTSTLKGENAKEAELVKDQTPNP